jgi:hypothetical protein
VKAASADSSNTPFSLAEINTISDGLRELRAYIENTHQLDEQKHAFLESRLGYLVEAAHRQGRQDWLHSAIGVLFTVVMGLAMAPDEAKEIFRFVGNMLQALLKTPPLLPYLIVYLSGPEPRRRTESGFERGRRAWTFSIVPHRFLCLISPLL